MYDPEIHHRRSIRWNGYDYSSPGAYYVTICVQDHRCLLGGVVDGIMSLNDAGRVVEAAWQQIPVRLPTIQLDEYVVMPNHIHGIVHIVGAPLVGALVPHPNRAGTRPAPTLGDTVGAFKSIATNEYIVGVRQRGWPEFNQRFWQRNYFEHVIRDQCEAEKIREYIRQNPMRWACDRYNPEYSVPVVDENGRLVPWNET